MVESRLKLEEEVQEILGHIDQGRHFLLSGGAGSGKTYSLVQLIRQVIAENPTAKVACMTYTNAAVKEIEHRVNHKNLNITTIHDFLWDNIKNFQKELKKTLLYFINDPANKQFSISGEELPINETYFDELKDGIQYKEYLRLKEGIISHDQVLEVANYLFETYPKLSGIVQDKYKFIFIDEYQDTSGKVVEIFLKHFKKNKKKCVVGFFGDAMQSIYDNGIGNLKKYEGKFSEVKKVQNRRNPSKIIELANKLRTDGIVQKPSLDLTAPNMLNGKVKEGSVLFVHSSDGDISKLQKFLTESYGWDFKDGETKELNLTHNLIGIKAGFFCLWNIYKNDPVIKLKEEAKDKIKEDKIEVSDNDTFDTVLEKVQLKNHKKYQDSVSADLYNELKDKLWGEVKKIYISTDALIDDKKQDEADERKKGSKRDSLIKHLFKIQNIISLYESGRFNEFIRATDFRFEIKKIADKRILKEAIEELKSVGDKTIGEIIEDAHAKGICLIDDKLTSFKLKNEYIYNRVIKVKFSEFQKLYDYLEGKTPFSTQHKTKGAEYKNVLVILDNRGWTMYNFEALFLNNSKDTILQRTQKLFYVCCTRAKENLAIFYHKPNPEVINEAKNWFGEEFVIDLDKISCFEG